MNTRILCFFNRQMLLSILFVLLQASTHVYGWCMPFSYDDWHSWEPCTQSCGGGVRQRVKYACVTNNTKHQQENCNEFCYNGGTFINGHCTCKHWRSGRCCTECSHIYIARCKRGKQSCGGSPDSIRCTDCHLPYTPAGYGKGCRRLSCSENNGACEHTCLTVRGSPTCNCKTGYNLSSDDISCLDIDECSTGAAKCSQTCKNTMGSFTCSCRPGYHLDSDGYTCSDEELTLNESMESAAVPMPSSETLTTKQTSDTVKITTKDADLILVISRSVSLSLLAVTTLVATVVIWRSIARRRARKENRI